MQTLQTLFSTAQRKFPNLVSDAHNPGSRDDNDGNACALGALMLAYAKKRRQLGLPYLSGDIKFGPFPRQGTGARFLQEFLAAFNVSVTWDWAYELAAQVMSTNDGSMDRRGNFVLKPQPRFALARLQEILEAKIANSPECDEINLELAFDVNAEQTVSA